MYNRQEFFYKLVKECAALKRSPKQAFEKCKYEGLKKFLPKDKKLRKKGHIIGLVNDLLDVIQEVYGFRPFIDFNTELKKLYETYLPFERRQEVKEEDITAVEVEKKYPKSYPKQEYVQNIRTPEIKYSMREPGSLNKIEEPEKPQDNLLQEPEKLQNNNLVQKAEAEIEAEKVANEASNYKNNAENSLPNTHNDNVIPMPSPVYKKRNEVFTPAKIDINRQYQIRQAVEGYVNAEKIVEDEAIRQYEKIKVDESRYTKKVDPEIAKLLGLNDDGEIV